MITESLAYLGLKGKDRVTGFEGAVLSVIFLIENNIQVLLAPPMDKDGKLPETHQFDINRIELIGYVSDRVMPLPDFSIEYIQSLGLHARDKITDFSGILCAVSYDLMGCVSFGISPPHKKKNVSRPQWSELERTEIYNHGERLMPVPTFGAKPVAGGETIVDNPSSFGHGPADGKSAVRCIRY